MVYAFVIASSIMLLFLLLQELGIINIAQTDNVNLPFVFLIGIIASLSTCMAVVGGLVLTLSSNYSKGNQMLPIIVFHASRVIGFFFLGGIIGLIGSAFILSQTASFILSIILFAVMIIIGINLLDIFPFVSKLQPQMPKFFGKNVLKAGQKSSALTPLFLGLLTFFLPCGFTQSMQIYSLTTGSFLEGALTMTVFSLGTLPVLSLISFASIKLSKSLQSGLFFKSAGILVIFFAVFNLHGSLTAAGII
jgi:sulfite exporter TauE/SafE